MTKLTDSKRQFWGKHLQLLAALLALGGISTILLSQQGPKFFAIGAAALFAAHIAAFSGLFLLGGGWLSKLWTKNKGEK